MPYAPGVTDISGQLFAQGLQQGISSLAQGLERNFQERKKKEEEKRAKEAVMQAGKGLFGDAFDLKDAPQDQWGKIIQLNQHKQQLPMLALQQENQRLRNQIDLGQINAMAQTAAQQQRNAAALAQAFNPTADTAAAIQGGAGFENLPTAPASDPMSAVMRAGKGGADAATLAHLAAMAENLAQSQQRLMPKAMAPDAQMIELGTDSYGRKIQGIRQPNGTVDRIPDPSGTSFEVGPNGQIVFRQGAQGNLTTQGSTVSQQNQFNAERIIKEGAGLLTRLRPQDIGVRGKVTEDIVNRGLAQIDPSLADETTAKNRTDLRLWREGTLKSVSGDTRFSNADRAAIEKLLPEDGYFESLPAAQAKILAVAHIMKGRAAMEANRRGQKSTVDLTPDELAQAAREGRIEKDVAAAMLSAFHPDWVAEQKRKASGAAK